MSCIRTTCIASAFYVVGQIKLAFNEAFHAYLGRNDSRTASKIDVNSNPQLLSIYRSHGLEFQDVVVVSASHSIGLARGGDHVTKPFDSTTRSFDTKYFMDLMIKKGIFHSAKQACFPSYLVGPRSVS
ncbi:hypothetical protein Peur_063157 [Populus x canadensis]